MNDHSHHTPGFHPVDALLLDIAAGRMVVIVDDEDRENEGDFICAAEFASAETVNFMVTHGRGLVCVPMTEERLAALKLNRLPSRGRGPNHIATAFADSVDAVGTTTGISAAERSATIRALVAPGSGPGEFITPGHVFPLFAHTDGVLGRAGHTEAAVDLARLAGLQPAGVLCEILNPDGSMARVPQLQAIARAHGLKIGTVADLVAHREREESAVVSGS